MLDPRRIALILLSAIALHAQAAPPKRVVSMLPSLTETVCVLGHCDALVGVDNYSNWPEEVKKLPHVGDLEDARVERIVALKPDLVLLSASSRARARLQALNVPTLVIEPRTVNDVYTAMSKIAEVFDEPQVARRMWARMNESIDKVARSVPPSRKGLRVYFEVGSGPYAASESSHIGELLKRLGADNIVPAKLGSVPKLNPEFVVRADPQVIMISERDAAEMRARPGWNNISAIRDGHVCLLDAAEGDIVVRPGPRLPDAARILAHCLAK
jgi:iron complex transport system substrate-binding protein